MNNFFVPAIDHGVPAAGRSITEDSLGYQNVVAVPYRLGGSEEGFLFDDESILRFCQVYQVVPRVFYRSEFSILRPEFEQANGLMVTDRVLTRLVTTRVSNLELPRRPVASTPVSGDPNAQAILDRIQDRNRAFLDTDTDTDTDTNTAMTEAVEDTTRELLDLIRSRESAVQPDATRTQVWPADDDVVRTVMAATGLSQPLAQEPVADHLEITLPEFTNFLRATGKTVRLHRGTGQPVFPVNSRDVYHVWVFAVPKRSADTRPVTPETYWAKRDLFGFRWSRGGNSLRPADIPGSMLIQDGDGSTVAQMIGKDIFILHDLKKFDSPRRADFMVLLEVLDSALTQDVPVMTVGATIPGTAPAPEAPVAPPPPSPEEIRSRHFEQAQTPFVEFCAAFEGQRVSTLQSQYNTLVAEVSRLQRDLAIKIREARQTEVMVAALAADGNTHREEYLREFERIRAIPKIKTLATSPARKTITVTTDPLTCVNPATNVEHAIGAFRITIHLASSGNDLMRFENLSRSVDGMFHPHVKNDGKPCFGNFTEGMPELVAANEYGTLIQMALRFLESVNPDDPWGRRITDWPVAGSPEDAATARPATAPPRRPVAEDVMDDIDRLRILAGIDSPRRTA